ncbi:MAG: hypothetical protein KDC69_12235 [Flavobacteriaceae bacterium]|nr:hypothetical protein [Flavobacteriaceae bacterium]
MKNKTTLILALLLVISMGTYSRIISDGNIKAIEFVSIFIIGAVSGTLITTAINSKKK